MKKLEKCTTEYYGTIDNGTEVPDSVVITINEPYKDIKITEIVEAWRSFADTKNFYKGIIQRIEELEKLYS